MWFSKSYFSEVFNHALFASLGVELNSRLAEVNCVLLQTANHIHYLLTVQQTSHVTDCGVLANGILKSVERVVEDTLVVAEVGRRCLQDASGEFDDGTES